MSECATLWTPEAVKDVVGYIGWCIIGIGLGFFILIPLVHRMLSE